jgi:hypothetical protein
MLFSVIIPLHNKKLYIEDTVLSVTRQCYSDFEIIIVDDESTDGSIDELGTVDDSRVRLISQKNAGPGMARNRGAAAAAGDWLAFIDADDMWAVNHLAVLSHLISSSPRANVVSTTSREFRHPDAFPAYESVSEDVAFEIDYLADEGERFVHASSIAIRRSTFLKTGGFGAFFPGEDTELWVRLALDNRFVISGATTSGYRRATGGIMEQLEKLNAPPADPGVAPAQITLGRALENPNYASRHAAINTYLDRARSRIAKIALVRGYPIIARRHLRSMTTNKHLKYRAYLALTWIPSPVLRWLLMAFSAFKVSAK